MVPTCGFKDHITDVCEVPLTIAMKVAIWPPWSATLLGDKRRLTGCDGGDGGSETGLPSNTVAVAVLLVSAALVAEIVTCISWVKLDGA